MVRCICVHQQVVVNKIQLLRERVNEQHAHGAIVCCSEFQILNIKNDYRFYIKFWKLCVLFMLILCNTLFLRANKSLMWWQLRFGELPWYELKFGGVLFCN